MIIIPLPRIPHIPVAALSRDGKEGSEVLQRMHNTLVQLLHDNGIHPVSLASDGSETERATQRRIVQGATEYFPYVISHEEPNCILRFRIPLFHGYPAIVVQDSKHALKTARNQLLTGARVIVLGNHVIHFAQLRELAEHPASPLRVRDVVNVDRQHDVAAARLFSSESLEFLLRHFSQYRGLATYIFVIGEMIDAWQNRNIPHIERIRMVLRSRFFLMAWRTHVAHHPDYDANVQFISQSSYDIFLTICDSLTSLVVVYRKFYATYPLLPWLHSTEPCEHLFGVLRSLKSDFTYSDFLYLYPKLRLLLMGAFKDLTTEQRAEQTSAGYHHTYFKADDLDLAALMQYPSDQDIFTASKVAYADANQLLLALGIDGVRMLSEYAAPKPYLAIPISGSSESSQSNSIYPSHGPRNLYELLYLHKDTSTSARLDRSIEMCEFALAAEAVDRTSAM